MLYTVNSDVFTLKQKGESITEEELIKAECNIEALVTAGHLKLPQSVKVTTTEEGESK